MKDRGRGAATRETPKRAPRERREPTAQPHGPPPDKYEALADKLAGVLTDALTAETEAYSVAGFCKRHGISLATFYNLAGRGEGPEVFHAGVRVLISKELAAAAPKARTDRLGRARS